MLRIILVVLAGCLFLVTVSNGADAYIEKSGNVSGETWAAGTYLITGNLTVNDNKTLTIEAGAVVKFQPSLQLKVYGTLDVNGVEGNNVVFTSRDDNTYGETIPGPDGSPSAGDCYGIYLCGYYNHNYYDAIGNFDWCRMRYGGNSYGDADANVRFLKSDSCYNRQ